METVVLLVILIGAVSGDFLLNNDVDTIQSLKNDSVQLSKNLIHIQNTVSNLQDIVSHLQRHNSQLQSTVTFLQSKGSGSTYVRWGRTDCPANGTIRTYTGYMGGGKNTNTGAAVNRLCMTHDPIWDHYDDTIDSYGKVYGVEYELWPHREDGSAAFFGTNLHNQDAPCAVCHSPRSAAMMIPGRNRCYPGWTKEYSGYLVSGSPADPAATEYICLDRRPESLPGGRLNYDGNLLYLVEGVCGGSLECPPYVNGRELTCVVCTE